MILPSAITLAICLFLGSAPSFTSAGGLKSRQGSVDVQALKSAPLGRRNLPGLDMAPRLGSERGQHEHGSVDNFFNHGPHLGEENESSSYGQDNYDPLKKGYDSAKETYSSGKDKYGLDKGVFDLGTGSHHALQEGTLDPSNGGYAGSDPATEIMPKPNASSSYGSEKKSYDPQPEKEASSTEDRAYTPPKTSYGSGKESTTSYQDPYTASSKDSGKTYDWKAKDGGEYKKPPATDYSKSTSGTEDPNQHKSKYDDKFVSPNGKKNGNDGKAKNSDQEGSFIIEPGTTEEQRKAAQKEGGKDGAYKAGEKNDKGGQNYSQPQVAGVQKDESSSYA